MCARRSCLRRLVIAFTALATAGLAACTAPHSIAVTSHADGARVYGSRTVTLAGTAQHVSRVRILQGGAVVATVDVAGDSFSQPVTLHDSRNELRVEDVESGAGVDLVLVYPWVDLSTFRSMDVVIGQADTTSSASGASARQIGTFTYADPVYVEGMLYVPDAANHRVLGFVGLPVDDFAAADFVLGQASFEANAHNDDDQDGTPDAGPSARTMYFPSAVASDGTRLFVADAGNNRVLIYNALPATSFAAADVVVGQASMIESHHVPCSLDAPFNYSERLAVGGGRLVVPQPSGNRVLVWNTIPTTNGAFPDLVLGQPATGATCVANDDGQNGVSGGDPTARTLNAPWGAWTDGVRLLVTDLFNHRVLLWLSFPASDFAPADVVIGQVSMTTRTTGASATEIGQPYAIASNGNQIVIPELSNSRVLVFDGFPTAHAAAADHVLGQLTFTATEPNDDDQDGTEDAGPSARTIGQAYGAWMGEGVLIINDYYNGRYSLFVD